MFKIFSQYFPAKVLFLILTENVLIFCSLLASIHIRFYSDPFLAEEMTQEPSFVWAAVLMVLLCQMCLYYSDLYDLTAVCRRSELLVQLIQALGGWCLLLTFGYILLPGLRIGRGILVITVALLLIGIVLWREAFGRLTFLFKAQERILILGTSQISTDLCRKLLTRKDLNFQIVGFLDENPDRVGERIVNPSIVGTIDQLSSIVAEERINRVIVGLRDRREKLPVQKLLKLRLQGVVVEDAHTLFEKVAGRISLDSMNPSWLIFSEGFRKFRWQLFLKRCFDVTLGLLGILLTFPLMVLAALCIKLDSKGPVLFRQERVGQLGRVFVMLKLRSMTAEAEAEGGPRWAVPNDARITRVGRVLRFLRLDELPQLFNILRGDMSFVGPRPERPFFVAQLEEKLKYYQDRHIVKPGLTGWAQINFAYASSEEEAREKLEYDFFYVKNFSILFDVAIIFKTMKTVLLGEGAR